MTPEAALARDKRLFAAVHYLLTTLERVLDGLGRKAKALARRFGKVQSELNISLHVEYA